jgi:hypothetical protein
VELLSLMQGFRFSQNCSCGLLLLGRGAVSLDDLCPTFRDRVLVTSSRVEMFMDAAPRSVRRETYTALNGK